MSRQNLHLTLKFSLRNLHNMIHIGKKPIDGPAQHKNGQPVRYKVPKESLSVCPSSTSLETPEVPSTDPPSISSSNEVPPTHSPLASSTTPEVPSTDPLSISLSNEAPPTRPPSVSLSNETPPTRPPSTSLSNEVPPSAPSTAHRTPLTPSSLSPIETYVSVSAPTCPTLVLLDKHRNEKKHDEDTSEDENIDDDSLTLNHLQSNVARSLKRLINDFGNLEKFYAEKRQKTISLAKQLKSLQK
ncbi:hypothetical protein BDC45DRAFT_607963 [Circinella umbellata]|nr:hypothetical protein BDC45DRAFT_607963 [Circinella umbellata]